MAHILDLQEEAEYMQHNQHKRLSAPFLRRIASELFLPEAFAILRLSRDDAAEYPLIPETCPQQELLVYAAVTKQRLPASSVRLEDGTPLIDPARLSLKRY